MRVCVCVWFSEKWCEAGNSLIACARTLTHTHVIVDEPKKRRTIAQHHGTERRWACVCIRVSYICILVANRLFLCFALNHLKAMEQKSTTNTRVLFFAATRSMMCESFLTHSRSLARSLASSNFQYIIVNYSFCRSPFNAWSHWIVFLPVSSPQYHVMRPAITCLFAWCKRAKKRREWRQQQQTNKDRETDHKISGIYVANVNCVIYHVNYMHACVRSRVYPHMYDGMCEFVCLYSFGFRSTPATFRSCSFICILDEYIHIESRDQHKQQHQKSQQHTTARAHTYKTVRILTHAHAALI